MKKYKPGMMFHNKKVQSDYIKLIKCWKSHGWYVLSWSFRESRWSYEHFRTVLELEADYKPINRLVALLRLGGECAVN